MTYRVVFDADAEADLQEIAEWIYARASLAVATACEDTVSILRILYGRQDSESALRELV